MRKELQDKEWNDQYEELTDEDLIEILTERYSPKPIPLCRICGNKLRVEACGPGSYVGYACSPYEEDPNNPEGKLRLKKGREFCDDHYSRSRVDSYKSSDRTVLELVKRFELFWNRKLVKSKDMRE